MNEKEDFKKFIEEFKPLVRYGVEENIDKWNKREKAIFYIANIYYQHKMTKVTWYLVIATWVLVVINILMSL
ncbi:MAG: hypothetical protein Q6363_000055 [Candidatus Njordarchaeota archaeon]